MTQHKYTLPLLGKSGKKYCNSVNDMLQYLTFISNTLYSVNHAYQYMHEPKAIHMETMKWILNHVMGNIRDGLVYENKKQSRYDGVNIYPDVD